MLVASMVVGGDHDAGDGGDLAEASGGGGEGDTGHSDLDDTAHGSLAGIAATLVSLRFWSFFAAFFGLTGVVFQGLALVESTLGIALLSVVVGAGAGLTATRVLQALQGVEVGRVEDASDYVGRSARVLLPFGKGDTGKVRLELQGRTVDVLASTDEEERLTKDEQVLIIEMSAQGATVARVTPRSA